jgi:hypothetical protein
LVHRLGFLACLIVEQQQRPVRVLALGQLSRPSPSHVSSMVEQRRRRFSPLG